MAMLLARSAFGARVSVSAPARMSAFSVAPVARPSASSSFLGGSFSSAALAPVAPARGGLVVMANAKKSMACTKEGTNQKRARTSGYRTRMETPNGRKTLKARRAKGRHVICPASQKKSGGKK